MGSLGLALAGSWAALCGGFDAAWRRIPNYLTLGGHLAGAGMIAATGHGWLGDPWTSCLKAWALALGLTLPAYALRWLGGGDVKLLTAMGLLGGIQVLLTTYVVGALLVAGGLIAWRTLQSWGWVWASPTGKKRNLPFGLGLSVGFEVALANRIFDTGWF
ncbi:MAG: A24 family peptidase [Methylohalobius sp. ZOD2]